MIMLAKMIDTLKAILTISLGIVIFTHASAVLPFVRIVLIIILSLFIPITLVSFIFKKDKADLLRLGLILIFDLILIIFKDLFTVAVTFLVSSIALLESVIYFIDYLLKRSDHQHGLTSIILKALLSFVIALLLFIFPLFFNRLIFILGGLYLISLGVVDLFKVYSQKAFSLSLPVFFSALIPVRAFIRFKDEEILKKYSCNDDLKARLNVNIYLQRRGFESFGHVDISIDNVTYSYGLHDPKARHIFGSAGEGVLIKVDRNAFIKNSLKTHKTMIVSFGLYPSDEEMQVIKERLNTLLKDAYPFDCAYKLDPNLKKLDYVSDVYRDTQCELLKFKKGPFKTYFVFTTNCVKLVDYLLRNKNFNLLGLNGIITPGDYLNFLYDAYLKKEGIVKELNIYQHLD